MIYNFNKKKLRRSIAIANIHGLTKLMLKGSTECVIHIKDEPDYRITCDLRDELFKLIKQLYIQIHSKNVPIYGISKSKNLSDFVTTDGDVKKGKTRIPLKLARIYDEDL